jgi:type I restriction enzyme, S subunit
VAKETRSTLVPRLRFPEFLGAAKWEKTTLGAEATFQRGRGISKAEVDPAGNRLCIRYGELYTRYGEVIREVVSRTNAPEAGLFLSCKNDVIIPASGETKEDIATASCVLLDGVALGSDLNVIRTKHNGVFLSYFLNGPRRQDIAKVAQGDTIVHLYACQLEQLLIAFPGGREQQKIADCLTSLDEVIAAQGSKVEALKTYKRGLVRRLFPREGETLPLLRVPDFRDAPEWNPTTLDALVDFQSGSTPSKANLTFWKGSIPWVSAKDMKRLFLEDAEDHISTAAVNDGAKLVPAGTVLMLTRGMTLLKDVPICVLTREMSFNQDVKALLPKGDADGLFVAVLLLGSKQRLLRMVDIAGHGTGKLSTDELKALELTAPKPAEQRRIADFLSALDLQIAAEVDKSAALKVHKRGLLRQLFPSTQEAL